jgi:Zn-dependent protease with chaperone function
VLIKRIVTVFLAGSVAVVGGAKLPNIKPGWNLFSKEQDIQIGKEAAQQYDRQLPLVEDAEINGYLTRLGQKLAKSAKADTFPYTFKAVNEKSINAFALPGGPTYYHTGLFLNAENEGQLVGVMAHEISHIALRHGTNQASKANAIKIPAMIAGALAGNGMLGSLAQLGIGLGANSILLKYGRNAERDADLYGAQIMAEAGYNPIEMARFFETLEKETGGKGGGVAEWFSSHPSPGNRVKSVSAILPDIPYKDFSANTGEFQRIKERVSGNRFKARPAATSDPGAGGSAGQPGPVPNPSSRLRQFQISTVRLAHPDNWEQNPNRSGSGGLVAPREGLLQNQQGNVEITHGILIDFMSVQSRGSLQQEVSQLVAEFKRTHPGMQEVRNGTRQLTLGGEPALMVQLTSNSARGGRELDYVVAVQRPEGLFYLVFISPEAEFTRMRPAFDAVLGSVRFAR